jgi:serine protease Do
MKKLMFGIFLLFSGALSANSLPDFTQLVEQYSPAVVNISTSKKISKKSRNFRGFRREMPDDMPDLFRHFFEREFDFRHRNFQPQRFQPQDMDSLGSGMIISADGYVLTNNHVVAQADEIMVRLKDRREFKAKVVGTDKYSDIAVLKIDAKNLPTVKIGKSRDVKVGEWVFAIGSPFGFDLSVSAGIVSAKGRDVRDPSNSGNTNYVPFIQTDVAINPGNSGGPLFNMQGKVIGVNSMIFSRSGGYMGLSFSIPIDVAMNVANQLQQDGTVTRGWLGVLIQPVTSDLAEAFGLDKPEGSLVAKVISDSPALAAGIKNEDIILSFNGTPINKNSDLPPIVASTPVGSSVPVEILRGGKKMTLQVTIGKLPGDTDTLASAKTSDANDATAGGMELASVPEKIRKELKLGNNEGVLVKDVSADSDAREAGIAPGDVIISFNRRPVATPEALQKLIADLPKGQKVAVYIIRASGPLFLAYRKQ